MASTNEGASSSASSNQSSSSSSSSSLNGDESVPEEKANVYHVSTSMKSRTVSQPINQVETYSRGEASDKFIERHKFSKERQFKKPNSTENVLTKLIPGYTAPLRLQSTLSERLPSSKISELREKATQALGITGVGSNLSSASQKDIASRMLQNRLFCKDSTCLSLERKAKNVGDTTAGKGWFNMQPAEMTDELKTDLKVLRMRGFLDPKRFYKSADKTTQNGNKRIFQVGTIVEGMGEFNSNRLTKKQRRQNLTEEIMADNSIRSYARKASRQISAQKEQRFYPSRRSKKGRSNK